MMVSDLTEELGYDFAGEDQDISGFAYYDEAGETDLTIAFAKNEINKTRARVVLTAPVFLETSKTLIMACDDLDLAMIKVCTVLIRSGILPDYGLPVSPKLSGNGYYCGDNCTIDETAKIYPGVIIGNDVVIGRDCVIGPFAVIGSGTELAGDVHVGSGSSLGAESFYHFHDETGSLRQFHGCGKTIIGEGTHIGSNTVIQRGTLSDTVIGKSCMIGNCIDIGHDVKIGNNCKIVSQTGIAGRAVLKNCVTVYGQVGIANNVTVGNHVVIKAKTLVSKSIDDNEVVFGLFGRAYADELKAAAGLRRFFERKDG